jgi:glycosyltransferase involved in cell wall biosynthesis
MTHDPSGVVVLFKGHSQYGSVATMVDQFAGALRRLGAETAILDTRAPDCVPSVVALLRQNRIRAFLSLNGYGIPSPGQGAGFYEISGVPVMIYFVDHPAYHFPTIRAPLPRLSVSFPTAHHVGFCRTHVRGDIPVRHLPHAAEATESAAWDGRDVPLFLSASLISDAEPFRAGWRQHGPAVETQLNAVVDAHDGDPHRPLHEHILAALGVAECPIEMLSSYFRTVDIYLRCRAKQEMVAALAHLPLVMCGEGWERVAIPGSAIRYLGPLPTAATIDLMRRSKLVLNPLPPYFGSHERPLQAMANGAVAAIGPSDYLAAAFPRRGYLALSLDPRTAAAELEQALADDDRLRALAAAGHADCMATHLWDHCAREFLAEVGGAAPAELARL